MRPVTLHTFGIKDPQVVAALKEIERASNDTLQNDQSSSGGAMATLIGAAANQIAYFTGQYTTAYTALTAFGRSLIGAASAGASLTILGVSAFIQTLLGAADAAAARSTLGAGTVTSIATTTPITGGTITGSGTIGFDTTALGVHLLNTLTASNSATLVDTTSLTSTYDYYIFEFEEVLPATNLTVLKMRVSTDGGATYKATGYVSASFSNIGTATVGFDAVGDSINLSGGPTNGYPVSNAASAPGLCGTAHFFHPAGASSRKICRGQTGYVYSGPLAAMALFTGYWDGGNTAINAIQFLFSSGNITSGKIRIYGVKTS